MSTSSIPMYEQIQNELMEQIQSGFFQPGDRIPSEKELAERYHVSRITAVKALTELALNGYIYRVQGRGSFANPLDKHLKPSALKLGGVPKNDGEPRPVSVLIPEHADYHSGSIIQGITQTLQYPECFVHLVLTHSNQLEEYALEQALKSGCAGVILFPVDCEVYSDTILRMHLNKFPLVLIDRCFPGIQSSCVCCDNEKGGWLAVEHLLSLGHRNICFIADSSFREQVTSVRYGAYVAAMTAQQLPLHAVERFNPQTFSQEEMERLLNAIRARKITAALVSNSHAAEWLLELCQTGGIRIPEELSVVCFDQPRIFQGMEPLFTYVEQNSFEMGRRAAELLRKAFETGQEHACQKLVLEPKLMIHHSTQTFVK